MYACFEWVYGIDLTSIAAENHKNRGRNYKYSENELSIGSELEYAEEGDFMSTAYAGSGSYPYYVTVDLGGWDEMDGPVDRPLESDITEEQKIELNVKLEKFREKCPILFSMVGDKPKIFLSRSTS